MGLKQKLLRKKSPYEKGIEPPSLNPNPMAQEGKLALMIALPLLGGLMAILYIGKNYYITEQEFTMLIGGLLGIWICFLVMIYGYAKSSASEYILLDTEFGFSERRHPRWEIYCKPEDIRLLIGPNDKIKDFKSLKEKISSLDIADNLRDKIIQELKAHNKNGFSKYLYYFRHKDTFEGWNKQNNTILAFKSHVIFIDKEFDKQFCFSAGQENWFGPIVYNHTHAESINVKVLFWGLDPFTNEPMPWCILKHGSNVYRQKKEKNPEEFKLVDACVHMIANLHGINETLRKEVKNVTEMKDANFAGNESIVKLAHAGSKTDIQLFLIAMKEVSRGWLRSGWFKALVSIVAISAIVLIVGIVFFGLDLSAIWTR